MSGDGLFGPFFPSAASASLPATDPGADEVGYVLTGKAMRAMVRLISGATDFGFLDPLVPEIVAVFGASRCSVMLLDRPGDTTCALRIRAQVGVPDHAAPTEDQPAPPDTVAGRVLRSGQATLIADRADFEARFAQFAPRPDLASAMCAPVATPHGTVFGVLNISRTVTATRTGPYGATDLDVCEAIAMLIGEALERLQSRDAERVLREQMRAVERLSVLGEIAAGIAHEIANPVATIRSNVSALEDYLDDLGPALASMSAGDGVDAAAAADLPAVVADIRDGVARVGEIIARMKDMVRPGVVTSARAPMQVRHVLDDAMRLVRPRLRASVRVLVDDSLVLLGNAVDFTQIFVNLIVNADDACAERLATVSRTDGSAPPYRPTITATGSVTAHAIVIQVADNGAGMSAETLERIFQPLFTTKVCGSGTGLGLSISRRLVEEHGGQVTAASIVGEGTTFTLSFPAAVADDLS